MEERITKIIQVLEMETMLNGNKNYSRDQNEIIINAVQSYITKSNRFKKNNLYLRTCMCHNKNRNIINKK